MALAVALTGGLVIGLIMLYLTRPRHSPLVLSAAIFIPEAPGRQETSRRVRLESLLRTPPFYLQLLVLILLLSAFLMSWLRPLPGGEVQTVGL